MTTRFRAKLSDYERVIALAQTPVHGTYKPVADKMLSYDGNALSPEAFRAWVLPPAEPSEDPDDEVFYGDGFVIPLDDPHNAEDVDHVIFERALEYCRSGKIGYVSVRNGVGRAYVEGNQWYELEFRLRETASRRPTAAARMRGSASTCWRWRSCFPYLRGTTISISHATLC